MTDGKSNSEEETRKSANALKVHNVTVFAIGVSNGVNKQELNDMATDASFVYEISNFNNLATVQKSLRQKTCQSESFPCAIQ